MKLLGNPTKDDLKHMGRNLNPKLPEYPAKPFHKVFPAGTNPQVLDLLAQVLAYNPKRRLSPLQALLHPYFDDLRAQKLTVNSKEIVDLFDFTKAELSSNPSLANKLVPNWYKSQQRA
jgi:glycogen synthase kinase 3 beta